MFTSPRAKLSGVTFTGADDTTSLSDISELADLVTRSSAGYGPGPMMPVTVELGLLLSESRRGTSRYPLSSKAYDLAWYARHCGLEVAVHLCDTLADIVLTRWPMLDRDFAMLAPWRQVIAYAATIGRIQINAPARYCTKENARNAQHILSTLARSHVMSVQMIMQHRDADKWPDWMTEVSADRPPVQFLFDCSGGRGILPNRWPELPVGTVVGLAGGIGPLSPGLDSVLSHIEKSPPHTSCWIDMESGVRAVMEPEDGLLPRVRSDGPFSISLCEKVLRNPHVIRLSQPVPIA